MKNRYLLVISLVIIILVLGTGLAVAQSRDIAPPQTMECPTNQTCHFLLNPGSEVHILTADGRVDIEVYGDDSILVENVD